MRGVKGLAPVFFGLVFGRGFGGCLRAENSPQSGIGFVGQSGVQVAGPSGAFSKPVRSFSVPVPGAMGRAGARYRESAFSIGCQYKTTGNRPLTSRSTGRQKRGAFGPLRFAAAPVTSALCREGVCSKNRTG